MEFGESPEASAIREVEEETGLKIIALEKYHFTNDIYANGTQYITLFFEVKEYGGVPQNLEPEKCEGWIWCDPENLPQPLFIPIKTLIREKGIVER
jgi:8-oxo-dGTP diphosphatase